MSAAALAVAGPAFTANERQLVLPAGPLQGSLAALANETGEQLVFTPALVAGRSVPALSGRYDVDAALARLLAGTDIEATRAGPRLVVLRHRAAATASRAPVTTEDASSHPFAAEAQATTRPPSSSEGAAPIATRPAGAPTPTVEAIEVTGTLIRGAGQGPSPLKVIDRHAMEQSGEITVAGVLNQLPQAFGGIDTEATVATGGDTQGNNSAYGTGVNLRGLGSNATLVLVNGRRLGGSGISGDFADVSTLPAIAVQRIEVLLDGASATYGADAVGGVVNVILRKDLDGGELQAAGSQGGGGAPREYQLGGVFGRTWSGGGALLAYEYYQRSALSAADRDYTASADLRPFGGTDHRIATAFPGNVVAVNPATGTSGPFFGIPPGQASVGLTPASFLPGAVNLISRQRGLDLLPQTRRQSVYAGFHQALTPSFEISGDVRYGFRASRTQIAGSVSTFTVGRANPFFVSPNGAASNQIAYSFIGELPNPVIRATADDLSASLGGVWRSAGSWSVNGFAGLAQTIDDAHSHGLVNTAILAEALGNVADNPLTAYSPARDGFFNPYTGLAANPPSVTQALMGFTVNRERSQVLTLNLQADGDLFALPGGEAKLAVGLDARRETFSRHGASFTSTATPTPQGGTNGQREVTAAFAELRAPLVSDRNARPGLQKLELSAAVRAEHYSDFGTTVDPKVGVLWTPIPDLNLRATYGRSFRAPSLNLLLGADIISPLSLPLGARQVLVLAEQGGNPGLRPETADSYTAGFDWRPHWSPGSSLSLTWFETDFQNRIDRPVSSAINAALTDPRFASFVQLLDPAANPADLAKIQALLAQPIATAAAGLNPAASYAAIVDLRVVNTGELLVRGLDLDAVQRGPAWGGDLTFHAEAAWLYDYQQRLTPTASISNFVGDVAFPSTLRGRASVDFTRGALGLTGALNYVSASRDLSGIRVGDQTTVDLQLRLRPRSGLLAGATASLSVRNLFNTAPPFYNNPTGFGFDSTNFDDLGRIVRLQITKSW